MRTADRRKLGVFVLALFATMAGGGREAAAEGPDGRKIRFPSGDRQIAGVLFEPRGRGPFAALVQIHASRGQERGDLELSQRLAAAGYLTLSVDLFGRVARDFGEGLRLRDRAMPTVAEDLRAAVAYLRTLRNVSPGRIGAIGASAGGGYTLRLAMAEPTLAAAVIYYGHVYDTEVVDDEMLRRIEACVLAIDAEESRVTSIGAAKMFANTLREAGKHVELAILPRAAYGFFEPGNANYDPAPAAEAWKLTLAFLKTHLTERTGSGHTGVPTQQPGSGRAAQ